MELTLKLIIDVWEKNLVNFYRRDFLSGTHSKYWLSFRFLNFLNRTPSPNLTRENISVEVFCKVESETGYYMLHNQHCHVRFSFRKLLPQIVMLQFICAQRITIFHHVMRKKSITPPSDLRQSRADYELYIQIYNFQLQQNKKTLI